MRFCWKRLLCAVLCLCIIIILSACGPSIGFENKQKQGLYPSTGEFPNTKWVCRELDMYIYMFGYAEDHMVGVYTVNNKAYRVVGRFEFAEFNFEFFSTTQITASEHMESMVHCDRFSSGFIATSYQFNKEDETIVCTLRNCKPVADETIPETLTFEKAGQIAQTPCKRWYSEEMDLFLDSYEDIDCYFTGQISIDGEKCYVHAIEIGNNNYFLLSIENGKVNNLISGTTSVLVPMYFEINEDHIVAKISDEYLVSPEAFPYWTQNEKTITLKPS